MPTQRKVWAVRINPQWVEIRTGKKPVRVTSKAIYETEVEQFKPVEKDGWYTYRFEKVKIPLELKQTNFVGGRTLFIIKRREFESNSRTFNFPRPNGRSPVVEITGEWAKNFLSPSWRRNNVSF